MNEGKYYQAGLLLKISLVFGIVVDSVSSGVTHAPRASTTPRITLQPAVYTAGKHYV